MSYEDLSGGSTFFYGFEIDGMPMQTVLKVDGIDFSGDVVEIKQNMIGGKPAHHAHPGRRKYLGKVTVTRVLTDKSDWVKWWNDVHVNGKIVGNRKHFVIQVQNSELTTVREFTGKNAFPTSIKYAGLDSAGTAPITEAMELQYDDFECTK